MIKNENPILVIKPSAQDHRPPMNSGGGEPKIFGNGASSRRRKELTRPNR